MAAPIIYMSSDGNAPVMSGTLGSLVKVLKQCLVTGYGDKAPAGWTMPFVNAGETKACFRNNAVAGTGFFIQVDASLSTTVPTVKAFETMSSLDVGVDEFTSDLNTFKQSATANTTARPWILIADDLFFYLLCGASSTAFPIGIATRSCSYLLFGDFNTLYPSDGFKCIFSTNPDTFQYTPLATCFYSGLVNSTGGVNLRAARNISGATKRLASYMLPGFGASTAANGGETIGYTPAAYSATEPVVISRVGINNGVAGSIRGFMPGLYHTGITRPNWNSGDVVTVDGKTYWPLIFEMYNTGYFLSLLVSTADWRA